MFQLRANNHCGGVIFEHCWSNAQKPLLHGDYLLLIGTLLFGTQQCSNNEFCRWSRIRIKITPPQWLFSLIGNTAMLKNNPSSTVIIPTYYNDTAIIVKPIIILKTPQFINPLVPDVLFTLNRFAHFSAGMCKAVQRKEDSRH